MAERDLLKELVLYAGGGVPAVSGPRAVQPVGARGVVPRGRSAVSRIDDIVDVPFREGGLRNITGKVKGSGVKALPSAVGTIDDIAKSGSKLSKFKNLGKYGKLAGAVGGLALLGHLMGGDEDQEEAQPVQRQPQAPVPQRRTPTVSPNVSAVLEALGRSGATSLQDATRLRRESDTRAKNIDEITNRLMRSGGF
jgi:hypothetical protein